MSRPWRSTRSALGRLTRSVRAEQGDILTDWQEARQALAQRALRLDPAYDVGVVYGFAEEEELEVGMLVPWSGVALPASGKYLWADGATFDPAAYPELAQVVGELWQKPGDAAGVRRVPDLRRRTLAGPGPGTATTVDWEIGDLIGAEAHKLSEMEMPSHGHVIAEAGEHFHRQWYRRPAAFQAGVDRVGVTALLNLDTGGPTDFSSQNTPAGAHTHMVFGAGGDNAHNNVQPTAVVGWLVRALP